MTMSEADGNFRAWYDDGGKGKSQIHVAGEVGEADGDTKSLVRAEPQGFNPRILMLRVNVVPFPGPFHPRIAVIKQLRYQEFSDKGDFTEVHIDNPGGNIVVKVGEPPG
jgi:hypothetical protein